MTNQRYVWNAEYETGDSQIDSQHQELLRLANLLDETNAEGGANGPIKAAYSAFQRYMEEHFADEEAYLTRRRVPFMDLHIGQHETLRGELRSLWEKRGDDAELAGFGLAMADWVAKRLVPHMVKVDRRAVITAERGGEISGKAGPAHPNRHYGGHIRLFIEEIFCELTRFRHATELGIPPQDVVIDRDVYLGESGSYADIFVRVHNGPQYYVEVKFGFDEHDLIADLEKEYGPEDSFHEGVDHLLLLVNPDDYPDWESLFGEIEAVTHPDLAIEVLTERELVNQINTQFGVSMAGLTEMELVKIRDVIDLSKWRYAFGEEHAESPYRETLLWHFSSWALHRLHEDENRGPWQVLRPAVYPDIVVLMADLCSFSSYVRDSEDPDFTRLCLETFYSKARNAILNAGGMMYKIVGDEVIGIFGLHPDGTDHLVHALECARGLADIGYSVSSMWQEGIDRMQSSRGVHVGMALGNLTVVPYRPFSVTQTGFLGETINLAARLTGAAGPGETVVSNKLYTKLPAEHAGHFVKMPPVDAKNMGRFTCWRLPSRDYDSERD